MAAQKGSKIRAPALNSSQSLNRREYEKKSTDSMLYSDASLTGGATLYCPVEGSHESKKSLVSNSHDAIQFDVNVPNVKRKLISKWRLNYKKHINVLEGQAVLLEVRCTMRQRAHSGHRITILTGSQVFC